MRQLARKQFIADQAARIHLDVINLEQRRSSFDPNAGALMHRHEIFARNSVLLARELADALEKEGVAPWPEPTTP